MFLTRSQSQREKAKDDLNLKERDGLLEHISISQTITRIKRIGSVASTLPLQSCHNLRCKKR